MTTYPIDPGTEGATLENGSAIRIDRAGKKYPLTQGVHRDSAEFWALKNVSFEISGGKVLGVIGRNGAGKTTLLNAIAGVLSLTEGEIKVCGKVLGLFNLGVGFQDELTGKENIFLNTAILGASKQEAVDRFDAITAFSELGEFINMPLGTYSQGMRLRLAFSIITHLDFEVLLMDEVLAVGDALFQSKCYERLMDFKRAGKTLVLTTQSMDMIERLCDSVVLLDHGRVVFSGSPVEATNKYRALLNSEQFYVGPSKVARAVFENTKKWVENISEWGQKLGTKEAVITSVKFINRWGFESHSFRSGQSMKIRVVFDAKNIIKEPHFGIAIFKNDGVYCYGPNTQFDQQVIREINPGRSWFELTYRELLLAPGDYKVSVAIWDKNEILPFDYHSGCYDLKIMGTNEAKELLRISCKVNGRAGLPGEKVLGPIVGEKTDSVKREAGGAGGRITSAQWIDDKGIPKDVLRTGETMTLKIDVTDSESRRDATYLWAGLFRDDDVYCQGFVSPVRGEQSYHFVFREFPLLPGGYKVSAGVWSEQGRRFLERRDNVVSFKMVFDREDHGTVFLKHAWKWEAEK